MTDIIRAPWSAAEAQRIKLCLQDGGTVAFPTETYYAVGGNALSPTLVDRIFQIKQRPRHKPLLLLIAPSWLPRCTSDLSPSVKKLTDHFWPGPLTVIVSAHTELPSFLQGPDHTVALRHSSAPLVQQLIALGDCPLIGTSANVSGFPETTQPTEVLSQLGEALDLLIDGGPSPGQMASTIVQTTTHPFQILRNGAIAEETLQPYLS